MTFWGAEYFWVACISVERAILIRVLHISLVPASAGFIMWRDSGDGEP